MKRRITRLAIAAAWIAIIAIAYATLTHVGFVYAIYFRLAPFLMHPAMQTYAHFEHVLAFAVLGALFGFAYPRHPLLVCCIVLGAAALLEVLQTTWVDAMEKMAGGAAGIALAKGVVQLRCRDRSKQPGAGINS